MQLGVQGQRLQVVLDDLGSFGSALRHDGHVQAAVLTLVGA